MNSSQSTSGSPANTSTGLLGEIEGVLNESSSPTAFPVYVMDITPAQQKTIEDYITRIRARLVQVIEGQGMSGRKPGIPVSRAVRGRLYTIDVAAEEGLNHNT